MPANRQPGYVHWLGNARGVSSGFTVVGLGLFGLFWLEGSGKRAIRFRTPEQGWLPFQVNSCRQPVAAKEFGLLPSHNDGERLDLGSQRELARANRAKFHRGDK